MAKDSAVPCNRSRTLGAVLPADAEVYEGSGCVAVPAQRLPQDWRTCLPVFTVALDECQRQDSARAAEQRGPWPWEQQERIQSCFVLGLHKAIAPELINEPPEIDPQQRMDICVSSATYGCS